MLKKLTKLLNILIIIFFSNSANSQTEIEYSQMLHFKNTIKIDSIFECFESPKIPKEIKFPYYFWSEFYVAAIVTVDTNYHVQSIKLYRLFEIDDDSIYQDTLWEMAKESIIIASKFWVFKPVIWKIPNLNQLDYGLTEHIRKSNIYKKNRPFGGYQTHLIIFQFINDIYDGDIPFLYQINVE